MSDATASPKAIHKTLKPAQATLLRCFTSTDKPLSFEEIEAMMVTTNKVGLLGALGGFYTRGIVTVTSGPVPTVSTDKVPRAQIDRKATRFALNGQAVIALCELLGLGA